MAEMTTKANALLARGDLIDIGMLLAWQRRTRGARGGGTRLERLDDA